MKPDVVIMAELDWGGLYSQSHVMAHGFAAQGHRVFYINRTLQRWPRLRHLITRLRPRASLGVVGAGVDTPEGISVVNLWVGPPVSWLRPLNKFLIRRKMKKYNITRPVFITYVPTFNSYDLSGFINPVVKSYVCYHNFDADMVVPDLLRSEKLIVDESDVLFADSRFLVNRIGKISQGREVHQAPPGVHFENFKQAFRGDEVVMLKKICFYGGAGHHLDLETYNKLCNYYDVTFIAVINPLIKEKLDKRIHIVDPVPNSQLPGLLKDMDILTILYKESDYIDGVLPAKFFECIATGKPVLVSGLKETLFYSEFVYDTDNDSEKALQVIRNLPNTHTQQRIKSQFELGMSSDFSLRFRNVYDKLMDVWDQKQRIN